MKGGLRGRIDAFMREIVFGLEDSLVSTLGAVTGIAAGTGSTYVVVMSGLVLIVVEALSMAAGSYLSSKSAREVFEKRQQQDTARILQEPVNDKEHIVHILERANLSEKEMEQVVIALGRERRQWLREVQGNEHRYTPATATSPFASGIVMGLFYLLGGGIPLASYFLVSVDQAVVPSILVTGLFLFGLGVVKAKFVNGHWLKSGFEMMLVSLSAAMLGFLIGHTAAELFGIAV